MFNHNRCLPQVMKHLQTGPGSGVPVVWRRTSTTHFYKRELHPMHRCLFRYRLERFDSLALDLMKKLDIPVMDWWSVTDGRQSGTADNRHWLDRGRCKGTRVQLSQANIWVNKISSVIEKANNK
ncbi:hypothetical protein SARC_09371 [Sphaeroforma arctica JP610]|uniref:Uncharacterized protein n=1 Tax=Sphaeroforma arctica JP610 TaxID=667725 RepID=A0A0L0FQB0_9EUKA|nr:hypothetical protein SARC_09371 [Sphaeroforma arctica JP610]KNC78188.1 hypothetical protein SARC_09371 [Sphaeroforma arctica JP610]|eukprot:XP_014152090.1 hypothetical protein SARC_09371 [Sphaeroforma arctica JP610]